METMMKRKKRNFRMMKRKKRKKNFRKKRMTKRKKMNFRMMKRKKMMRKSPDKKFHFLYIDISISRLKKIKLSFPTISRGYKSNTNN